MTTILFRTHLPQPQPRPQSRLEGEAGPTRTAAPGPVVGRTRLWMSWQAVIDEHGRQSLQARWHTGR